MEDQRVIVLSDIHADLEAFIICLRDCANVIKKKDGYPFIQDKPDSDLYIQLQCPSVTNKEYVDDLHYEWIGGSTRVIIIGDLIDGAREDESVKKTPTSNEEMSYYPQVEIKLLRFINALNEHAMKENGGFIKIIGNHDYENFQGNMEMMESYIFTPDRTNEQYYIHQDTGKSESRYEYFQFGHDGYKLYQATLGMYLFYQIDDMLFIHGQLPSRMSLEKGYTMKRIQRVNELLHEPYTKNIKKELDEYAPIIEEMLWNRTFGDKDERGDQTNEEFEKMFKQDMFEFTGSHNMRLFIGHCQQHTVHIDPYPCNQSTLGYVEKENCNDMIEVYSNKKEYHGLPDCTCYDENKTFGVVTECFLPERDGLYQPHLCKVDNGMSRGQEYINEFIALKKGKISEINYFRPKAPQVMEIIGSLMKIKRCTIKNMIPHMDRNAYKMFYKPANSLWNINYGGKKIRKSPRKHTRRTSPKKQ
jgi:hypothetical protein